MASGQEFSELWQRLSIAELEAIAAIAKSPKTSTVSTPMAFFLAEALEAEANHREHFRTKPAQVPPVDRWSDSEVAAAYFAAVMIKRALAARQSCWANGRACFAELSVWRWLRDCRSGKL